MIPPLPGWFSGLARWRSGPRWILYCTPRNPTGAAEASLGDRIAACGVRRPELPEWYWKALDRGYKFLTKRGASKLPKEFPPLQIYLVAGSDGETAPVLVKQVSKQGTTRLIQGVLIQLPVRNPEPYWDVELAQALTTAVHELSHALNMQILPLAKLNVPFHPDRSRCLEIWKWFDEGMAVAVELAFAAEQWRLRNQGDLSALPVGAESLCWGLKWVDHPERAVDDPEMLYQAGFFARYLERRIGDPRFLHEVWAESARVWDQVPAKDCTPLNALVKICRQRKTEFCSSTVEDLFASGYCFDSYFLNDPQSKAHEPEIFARFRERAVTRTWRMTNQVEWLAASQETYFLPSLACRYFRFLPPPKDKVATLKVRVTGPSTRSLKAELALAFGQPETGFLLRDQNGKATRVPLTSNGNGEYSGEIQNFSESTCNHAVLVITNCDLVAGPYVEINFGIDVTLG